MKPGALDLPAAIEQYPAPMGALDAIEWQACLLEPVRNGEAERYLRQTTGMVSPTARYFLDSPWVVRAMALLDVTCVPLRHVESSLAGMIALVVSQDNSCRYCYAATRSILQILGFPEARIRRLEDGFLDAEFTPLQRAALDLARRISRAAPLCSPDAARPLLDAGGSVELAQEVAYLAATNVFFNRVSTLAALPPAKVQGMASHWRVRLLRPLIAARLRNPHAAAPTPLQPAQRTGLYADFVNALDGLPAAPRLRAVLDEAWDSPLLPRRLKGLVFAVVGRGIGCPRAEAEASAALRREGMSPEAIDAALSHLSDAALTPLEEAALALARESIWAHPTQLQQHARALQPHVTRQQFVELIALAALANTICRLFSAVDLAPRDT